MEKTLIKLANLFTFSDLKHKNIANADILQGKELSYNNIVDADAAWECVESFDDQHVSLLNMLILVELLNLKIFLGI